jgi:hypothetical protein
MKRLLGIGITIACVVAAFVIGLGVGKTKHAPNEAVAIEIPDMEYRGDLMMTVAIGMCGSSVITDVGFAAADPNTKREVAFHHDTGSAVGLIGLPDGRGVYQCLVSEFANDYRREFRVRDYWEVGR